jgi:hypothetical protein
MLHKHYLQRSYTPRPSNALQVHLCGVFPLTMNAYPVEINQLDLAIVGHHDILMTEIAKDIVGLVETFHSFPDIPGEGWRELVLFFSEPLPILH